MSTEDGNAEERGPAATESEGTTSPLASSAIFGSEVRRGNTGGTLVDAGAPGLDTHHWAGVRRGPREGDARSVASSLAAEKDALSVYDNQECELGPCPSSDQGLTGPVQPGREGTGCPPLGSGDQFRPAHHLTPAPPCALACS